MKFPKEVVDLVVQQDQMLGYRVSFVLMPKRWKAYKSKNALGWKRVPFDPSSLAKLPANESGVYCFVIEPSIASHPASGHVMYVGMTDRSFQERFDEYLKEPNQKKPRPSIMRMFVKWPDQLYFYYAKLDPSVDHLAEEKALIAAFLPPANKSLPVQVRRIMGAFS